MGILDSAAPALRRLVRGDAVPALGPAPPAEAPARNSRRHDDAGVGAAAGGAMKGRLVRADERARIVALHVGGMKWDLIAMAVGRPRRTVQSVIHAAMPKPPRRRDLPRYRENITWVGRCPAFRPLPDERRGRMAHYAD